MEVRSKVWFELDGGPIFGAGKARILEAVSETGSLNKAAGLLKLSYRKIWSHLFMAEKRLGKPLIIKTRGGSGGGGATLSPFGKELLIKFRNIEKQVMTHADKQFDKKIRNEA